MRRVYHALYRGGGVIAQCEFSAGSKPENIAQVYQSWNEVHGEKRANLPQRHGDTEKNFVYFYGFAVEIYEMSFSLNSPCLI